MSLINVSVPTASEATMASNLPAAGYKNLFYNTDDNEELYSIDSNGVIAEADDAECCACEIAKKWMSGLTCSLEQGLISATDYQSAMAQGLNVVATEVNGTCTVTISAFGLPPTSVIISDSTATVAVLATKQLTANVVPGGADQRILWASGGLLYATVDQTGLVTGVATGTAIIYAYSIANPAKFAICTITVP